MVKIGFSSNLAHLTHPWVSLRVIFWSILHAFPYYYRYATEHTSRINRIIKQRGGHALLVGVGGSGRQSLAKLATFIANYELFQIEVNKTYGIQSWRNDLKKVLKMAGADCKNVVFLFTDLQIKDEAFLEDISMVLNTVEVPNLFATDEKTEILERVQVYLLFDALLREKSRKE